MPEIKHTFQGGKMNKDLDERLVRNGEYRNAMNIQVRSTDASSSSSDGDNVGEGDAGTVQNLKGNAMIGEAYFAPWMADETNVVDPITRSQYPRCVANIADEKNDKAYFFFASSLHPPSLTTPATNMNQRRVYVDSIVEQSILGVTTPVVVDVFGVIDNTYGLFGGSLGTMNQDFTPHWSEIIVADGSLLRPGMTLRVLNSVGGNVLPNPAVIKSVSGNNVLFTEKIETDPLSSGGVWWLFEAERVLNFTPPILYSIHANAETLNIITGVNIIDNLIFWTDNNSEPKKINIDRCKAGTNINGIINDGKTHTKLFVNDPSTNELTSVENLENELFLSSGVGSTINNHLKEEHITVMRKAPKTPPSLHMSSSDRNGLTSISVIHFFITDENDDYILQIGDIQTISSDSFLQTEFRKDDILIFKNINDNSVEMRVKFLAYEDSNNNETLTTTTQARVQIIMTNTTIDYTYANWYVDLEQRKPLFETKLARFGYRYKYEDGEYSAFSPWSEVAFLPGEFDYSSNKAYNLGMINTVRELTIKDFIPYKKSLDISEIDILYKTTDSPNVYIVDTIKRNDGEWEHFTPNGNSLAIETGQLSITSEMIHRVLPSNQMLRSWDNVPRKALAQEIIGNRLIYGNYIQGFNISGPINLTQSIISEEVLSPSNPKKSIKSIRDYKVGLVYGDKYGRETPVITPGYSHSYEDSFNTLTGDVSIEKTLSDKSNSLQLSQTWQIGSPPDEWIDYVKYYIKETSNEYYNLIMDRWYDSGDDTVWLSFNSADRNKVDEETYLILKNVNGTDDPVYSEARYKIIAIENEAPDYIKTKTTILGVLGYPPGNGVGVGGMDEDNTVGIWAAAADANTSAPAGLINNTSIKIKVPTWDTTFNSDSAEGIFGKKIEGDVEFRVIGYHAQGSGGTPTISYTRKSAWRKLSNYMLTDNGENVQISWAEKFAEDDINHYQFFCECDLGTNNCGDCSDPYITSGQFYQDTGQLIETQYLVYTFEFKQSKPQNLPEFDGKFFVKIQKNSILHDNVLTIGVTGEYQTVNEYPISYISSTVQNEATIGEYSSDEAVFDANTAASYGANPYVDFFGAFNGVLDQYDEGTGSWTIGVEDASWFEDAVLTYDGDLADTSYSGTDLSFYQGINATTALLSNEAINNWLDTSENPEGLTAVKGANEGVFASCTYQHNEMTKNFWTAYRNNSDNAFIDGARARFMTFDSFGAPEGGEYFTPESFVPDSAANNTVGEMTISYLKSNEGAILPKEALYNALVEGTEFSFGNGEDIFRVQGVIESNNPVKNFSTNTGYTMVFGSAIPSVTENCNFCEHDENLDTQLDPSWQPCERITKIVQFRKINQTYQTVTNDGLDINEYDPRGQMAHDGSTSITIKIKQLITTETISGEDSTEKGACFETQPKEGTDVELYHEASHAIPMKLTEENMFDYAPVNSKVKIERVINNRRRKLEFSNFINHRVNNLHFLKGSGIYSSNTVDDDVLVSIVADDLDYGDNQFTKLYSGAGDILIGDELIFEHNDGTETRAQITSFYKPFVQNNTNFSNLSDDDEQYGVVSGPKAFEKNFVADGDYLSFNPDNITGEIFALYTSTSFDEIVVGSQVVGVQISAGGWVERAFLPGTYVTAIDTSGTYNKYTFSSSNDTWLYDYPGTDVNLASTLRIKFQNPTGYFSISTNVWNQPVKLPWHNCWSFGNGVESDRIRDDYNAPRLDNGAKVSTTFSGYKEENIGSGLIYSGLYNSTSNVNDLNEFNMSEKITKELNPSYGSIQRLKTRDTDIVVFTEDKVLKILSNKDALYNADGNTQLTATNRVLGSAVPFVGDYGISKNPESLSWDQYRLYFTDMQRGAVLRLSRDGLTPISDAGMKTYFRDNLKFSKKVLGTFDRISSEYNVTLLHSENYRGLDRTISYHEPSKGWSSFKSFIPSSGLSIGGKYLTTNNHRIYEHHLETHNGLPVLRNSFYDTLPTPSSITVLFNDLPSVVKSFKTINYEGSQSAVTKNTITTKNVYNGNINFDENDTPQASQTVSINFKDPDFHNIDERNGWFVSSLNTDMQNGSVHEFIEKEGKWFNYIHGNPTAGNNLNFGENSVQGVGQVASVLYTEWNGDVVGDGDGDDTVTAEILGCTNPVASNFNNQATQDDGSCVFSVVGCMDYADPNYDPTASIHTNNACAGVVIGCMDEEAVNYNPNADIDGAYIDENGLVVDNFEQAAQFNFNTMDNYSCIYYDANDDGYIDFTNTTIEEVTGCMDSNYAEYNPFAVVQEDGDCVTLIDNTISWGCTDISACNYDINATEFQFGSCLYWDCLGVCGGSDICGCQNPLAINYNPNATTPCYDTENIANGFTGNTCCISLDNTNFIVGCTLEAYVYYNPNATIPCSQMTSNGLMFNTTGNNGCCGPLAVIAAQLGGCTDSGFESWSPYPGEEALNYDPAATYQEGDCYYASDGSKPGCTDPIDTLNYDPMANIDDGSCIYKVWGCTNEEAMNYDSEANWPQGDDNAQYCIMPFPGCMDNTMINYNPNANYQPEGESFNASLGVWMESICEPFVYGCLDPSASNYDGFGNTLGVDANGNPDGSMKTPWANWPTNGAGGAGIGIGSPEDDGTAIQQGCIYEGTQSLTFENYSGGIDPTP